MTRMVTVVLVAGLGLGLVGCSAPPSPEETPAPTTSAAAEPSLTPTPTPTPTVDPDLLLTVTAKATSVSGNSVDLRLDVYRPVAPDSPEAADYRAAMDARCTEQYYEDVYAQPGSGFIREVVTVTPTVGSWGADDRVGLVGADWTNPQPGGIFDAGYTDSNLYCQVGNTVRGTGTGTRYLLASQNLDIAPGPISTEQSFAVEQYGFWVFPDASESDWVVAGVIDQCVITLTDAGTALLVGGLTWADQVTDSQCATGIKFSG